MLVPYSESDAEAGSQVEDAASSCCEVQLATRPKVNRALLPELEEAAEAWGELHGRISERKKGSDELECAKQERDKYQTLYSLEKDTAAGDRLEAESSKRDLKHEQEQHMGTLKKLLECQVRGVWRERKRRWRASGRSETGIGARGEEAFKQKRASDMVLRLREISALMENPHKTKLI